jgi:hypothetical protein
MRDNQAKIILKTDLTLARLALGRAEKINIHRPTGDIEEI